MFEQDETNGRKNAQEKHRFTIILITNLETWLKDTANPVPMVTLWLKIEPGRAKGEEICSGQELYAIRFSDLILYWKIGSRSLHTLDP